MKSFPITLLTGACFSAAILCTTPTPAADRIELKFGWRGPELEASWPAEAKRADGSTAFPLFQLQRSADLQNWTSEGPALQGFAGGSDTLNTRLSPANIAGFYRLSARFSGELKAASLATSGAEVFGYASAFDEALASVGQITPEQFTARYSPPTNYLAALDWDPTTARFWDEFNTNPFEYNRNLIPGVDDFRNTDFRLSPGELAVFKKNGFVVSERLGAPSCGEILARLWEDDLPVYITPDLLLQAWHRSYDMMLSDLEEAYLFEAVRQILDGMSGKVAEAAAQAGDGPLHDSVLDADYMVTVARSLLAGSPQESQLGQNARVAAALTAVEGLQMINCFDLFGQPREIDFSQFKPRGHYTESKQLSRYFQCVKWMGRIQLRVAGGPFQDSRCGVPHDAPTRELGTSIVLNHLVNASGQFGKWQQFDHLIQTLVGWTDSMTFAQLGDVLRAAGIQSLTDVSDLSKLQEVQAQLLAGTVGVKNIRADFFISPLGPEQAQLPRTFTMFGGKFVLDSWALSKSVFDSIFWDENGIPERFDKVPRNVPSALDVAFSVFGNNQIVPEIVARINDQRTNRHVFRDGWPYQHNLAATRTVVDQQSAASWNQNLYMSWVATLRQLSPPVTDVVYPDAMRTRAWAMKDLNAQLASWTHMRHDTVLYAEQSMTTCGMCGCSYPRGFVEPRPAFWRQFTHMASNAAALIAATDFQGTMSFESPRESGTIVQTNLLALQSRLIECFQNFATVTETLRDMSERELQQVPFTEAQDRFLQNTLLAQTARGYDTAWWEVYDGWYPKLFYHPFPQPAPTRSGIGESQSVAAVEGRFHFSSGALKWDALVTDVHTDVPCMDCPVFPDPGSVLHQAIGNAHLLMIAINNGADRTVYAGPVLSHYEFEIPGPPSRMSDPEWKAKWTKAGFGAWSYNRGGVGDWSGIPQQPEWTGSYLTPITRSAPPSQP
ncbi:MAG TPA: DUF3160 domain-containing protein [Verrucomicrobiae bacterium]|nr:DUF3160 domain-containing protein [Verrucomicrobiae bacterium]